MSDFNPFEFTNSVGTALIDNNLGTNFFGDNATDKAIKAQTQGTNQANAVLGGAYGVQNDLLNPWAQTGTKSMTSLANNDFMNNWQQDPGYQFRLDEGNKAINAAASARGLGNSGATMKALARYGQDYATGEYDKVYNRNYNRLSQLAGFGQDATNSMVNASANYGNSVSNNYMGLGNANAAAQVAQSNRFNNLLGQGAQGATMALMASDERLKTEITPINKEDLEEMKFHLKAFAFKYKDELFGKGEWIGVMAQDLEKSKIGKTLVVEDEQGNKLVDLKKVMSLFLATLAEG